MNQRVDRCNQRAWFCCIVAGFWAVISSSAPAAEPAPNVISTNAISAPVVRLPMEAPGVWVAGVGDGFRAEAQSFGFGLGAGPGFAAFGSHRRHDLALADLSYGHMLGHVTGGDHWYRGNWELLGELFGGAQFSPNTRWLVGLTPHLRYNLATGTRLVPFIDGGAGVSGTDIGRPDLGGKFQFNLQGGVGALYFFRDDVALTVEARYMHISSAGIYHPNNGVNTVLGVVGISWFF